MSSLLLQTVFTLSISSSCTVSWRVYNTSVKLRWTLSEYVQMMAEKKKSVFGLSLTNVTLLLRAKIVLTLSV